MSRRAAILGSVAAVAGCSRGLLPAPTPTVFASNGGYPADKVPAVHRTATAPVLFVTDRELEDDFTFGVRRSPSLSYGEFVVNVGDPETTWDNILDRRFNTDQSLAYASGEVNIYGALPPTPTPFRVVDGRPVDIPEQRAIYDQGEAELKSLLTSRLNAAGTGDVLLFIPGINTTFNDGIFELADVWHLTGRTTIPILFSWPSGSGGVIGYFTDRESGQFSIFHLKEFLTKLANTPGVERIHILAHSRGTDVATTALRELVIAERAAGRDPRKTLKVENLILAAADLNFDVVSQRIVAERLGPAFGQITAYTNPGDRALALAQRLMTGSRFGQLRPEDVPPHVATVFEEIGNVNFIWVENPGTPIGHSYYRLNPDVMSDIIMTVRSCARPGTAQRPLDLIGGNFWVLPDGYLNGVPATIGGC